MDRLRGELFAIEVVGLKQHQKLIALNILGPSLEGVEPSSSQGLGAPNQTLVFCGCRFLGQKLHT